MSGALALGGNLNKYSTEDLDLSTRYVAAYKRIRETVQRGARYRLIPPEGSENSAVEYVSNNGNQAVLFAFLHSEQFGTPFPTVYLQGLQDDARYKVEPVDSGQAEAGTFSGSYLMHHGLNVRLRGDYDSAAVILEKQP
jgi:alpha-galactosidase